MAVRFALSSFGNGMNKALCSRAIREKHTLVVIRHGQSQVKFDKENEMWNLENRFTGWVDCPLTEKGKEEAKNGGRLLKEGGFEFDVAYTSVLRRAIQTLWFVLDETEHHWIPVHRRWRLNERHYGALQGLNKAETAAKHGEDQVKVWRRSFDIPPPEMDENHPYSQFNERRYADLSKNQIPKTESLKLTIDRFLPVWEEISEQIKQNKRVLVAAHGNSLRALVKNLDGISDKDIIDVNIPTGVPLVYELDSNLKPIPHPDAISPLSGRYLGDIEAVKKAAEAVANQSKKN